MRSARGAERERDAAVPFPPRCGDFPFGFAGKALPDSLVRREGGCDPLAHESVAGKASSNVDPAPGSLSSRSPAAWPRTIPITAASPRPRPTNFVE